MYMELSYWSGGDNAEERIYWNNHKMDGVQNVFFTRSRDGVNIEFWPTPQGGGNAERETIKQLLTSKGFTSWDRLKQVTSNTSN